MARLFKGKLLASFKRKVALSRCLEVLGVKEKDGGNKKIAVFSVFWYVCQMGSIVTVQSNFNDNRQNPLLRQKWRPLKTHSNWSAASLYNPHCGSTPCRPFN